MRFSQLALALLSLATVALAEKDGELCCECGECEETTSSSSTTALASNTSSTSTHTPTTTTDPPEVTGIKTEVLTSTYCSKCDEEYTTSYIVSWVDVCSTGLTTPVYTITETRTGDSATFTPTTCPPEFTVIQTVCDACEHPNETITVTRPITTTEEVHPTLPPTKPPVYPITTPLGSSVKPGGTTFAPPAATTGPQLVSVNSASGSSVQFFTVSAGIMFAVFAGMLML